MALIKLNARGIGEGKGPVGYLLSARDHKGKVRSSPPRILYGDPILVEAAIDSSTHKRKYISGTVSFAAEEAPSEEQQAQIMADCEALWFTGIEEPGKRIPTLWVLHTDKGRVELNFLIPRLDLATGKSFNPCPPGCEAAHDVLVDLWDEQHPNIINPRDKARSRDLKPQYFGKAVADKAAIHEYASAGIEAGLITDRESLVAYLVAAGMVVSRQGKDYITVQDENGNKARMKGAIYGSEFSASTYINSREITNETAAGARADRAIDERALQTATEHFEQAIANRARYNLANYALPSERSEQGSRTWRKERHRTRKQSERLERVEARNSHDRQRLDQLLAGSNIDFVSGQGDAGSGGVAASSVGIQGPGRVFPEAGPTVREMTDADSVRATITRLLQVEREIDLCTSEIVDRSAAHNRESELSYYEVERKIERARARLREKLGSAGEAIRKALIWGKTKYEQLARSALKSL
jgi:hypothetical protein